MATIFYLQGRNIIDIPSFYEEINRVFMQDEDWQIGTSLDALDDMLYGGFSALKGAEKPIEVIWKHSDYSRKNLGIEETRSYYLQKLQHPEVFNIELQQQKIADLENGRGKTYFDILVEIFDDHPNIQLILK